MTEAIVFKNVSLGYVNQTVTLKGLNLNIKAGSFHYLTGSSGAGKSLLIKAIHAQILPLSGQLTVLNRSIDSFSLNVIPNLRQRIGVVLQDFKLIDNLSLIENVALPLHIQGMDRRQSLQLAYKTLEWLNFEEPYDIRPRHLSGGQKQRIMIARAIVGNPLLLLADEATGNLDDIHAVHVVKLFEQLQKAGMTIIFVTHNYGLIRMFKHPIIHIHDDTAVQLSAIDDVESQG